MSRRHPLTKHCLIHMHTMNAVEQQHGGDSFQAQMEAKKKSLPLRPKWRKSRLKNGIFCMLCCERKAEAKLNGPSLNRSSSRIGGQAEQAGCCNSAVIKYRRWMFVWTIGIHCRAEAITLKGEALGWPCLCNDLTVWIKSVRKSIFKSKLGGDLDPVGSLDSMERLLCYWPERISIHFWRGCSVIASWSYYSLQGEDSASWDSEANQSSFTPKNGRICWTVKSFESNISKFLKNEMI